VSSSYCSCQWWNPRSTNFFFSEELSEEYQIKGRCARQGDPGSFKIVLLANSLEAFLGPSWEIQLRASGIKQYEHISIARNTMYESTCASRFISIEQCKKDHEESKKFMEAIMNLDAVFIRKFVGERNKGATIENFASRTVLLMDATGSMGGLLSAVKDTVCKMFELTSLVLKEKGFAENNFQMQFVVYRDYDCKDNILNSSAWETKPSNLRSFMELVNAQGGGDYEEAIEIGLWHAVQQSIQSESISQVLLIADAPAKGSSAITKDRNLYGGESYWFSKLGPPTHYLEQLEYLCQKEIPVHTFFLHKGAEHNFKEIASKSGGTCRKLDINSKDGAQQLTNLITEEILRKSAGDQGEELVKHFRATYAYKSFLG